MKNWKNSKLIKILSTVTALAIGAVIIIVSVHSNVSEAEARTNILKRMTDAYGSRNSFKILEVVPSNENNANEEIGYFMRGSMQEQMSDYYDVSKAQSIGSMQAADGAGIQNLLTMRDYGLIKEANQDSAKYGLNSDNPVYSDFATFAYNRKTDYTDVGYQLVYGKYSFSSANTGGYNLKDGYTIDDNGIIYRATVSDNTIPSVSGNGGLGGRTVNHADRNSGARTEPVKTLDSMEITELYEVATADVNDVTEDGEGEVFIVEEEDDTPNTDEKSPDTKDSKQDEKTSPNNEINQTGTDSVPQDNTSEIDANSSEFSRTKAMQGMEEGYDYTEFVPVDFGNPFNKALPEGVEPAADGNGNLRFEINNTGKYFGHETKKLYYYTGANNKFRNGNWFNEFVFGDSSRNISYSIDTKSASSVTASDMKSYDLIYISGTKDSFAAFNEDLSTAAAIELYNGVIGETHQAVIMDYDLLDNQTLQDQITGATCTNIQKLALLLWQSNQKQQVTTENGFQTEADNGVVTKLLGWDSVTVEAWLSLSHSSNIVGGYGNFVAGSVYVYDHMMQYFNGSKAQIDAHDFFGNGDFNVPYIDSVVVNGFANVQYSVKINNTNNPGQKMSEAITPAVIVQYILTYDGTESTLVKSSISVLEIQPCRDFSYNTAYGSESYEELKNSSNAFASTAVANRKQFILDCLGEPFCKDGRVDEASAAMVTFTSMTIDEFICRTEKLSEVYDVIYIGSNYSKNKAYPGTATGQYYTVNNIGRKDSTQPVLITDFEDNRMDGMVYYNIGDLAKVKDNGTGKTSIWGTIKNEDGTFRFAARDLTKDRKIALLNFLKTGYPIIVAGDLMTTDSNTGLKVINPTKFSETRNLDTNGFDHGRIDNSSVMYEFFEVGIGRIEINEGLPENANYSAAGYENLFSMADLKKSEGTVGKVSKEAVNQAINQPKLELSLTSKPIDYEYTTDASDTITAMTTLQKDSNGKYMLTYEFSIDSISADAKESDIYNAHLYIDVNADGRFSETEELDGIVITNALTGEEITYVPTITGNAYSLTTNVLYKLTREVPDGYQGVLPWCLSVSLVSNENISASETGYTAIRESETTAVPIKILQIMKDAGGLNLQTSISGGSNNFGRYIKQLKNLNMFDIQVESITISAYREQSRYFNNLKDKDMLILGFADNYPDIVDNINNANHQNAMKALEEYIASGKPVLLTHDFMAHYPNYTVVQRMRGLTGMDRYGATDKVNLPEVSAGVNYSTLYDAAIMNKIKASGKRVAYMPNSGKNTIIKYTQSLTNNMMIRYHNNTPKRYIYADSVQNWNSLDVGPANNAFKVNEGQITNYPYKLPDVLPISTTHHQYFQLDMDIDQDKDGSSDVVVWYTLGYNQNENKYSNNVHNVTPKDGVNNFFIYNCGNITYTGSGHSGDLGTNSKYEAQLFVNTMVAAYKAGVRSPVVSMYESSDVTSDRITSIAIPYDRAIGKNATDTSAAESSLLLNSDGSYKYPFVDYTSNEATKVWFRIADPNLVKGTKKIAIRYLMQVETPENEAAPPAGVQKIELANGDEVWVREINMPIYNTDFSEQYDYTAHKADLRSGTMYGVRLPMNLLKDYTGEFALYIEAQTTIQSISITGDITVTKSNPSYTSLSVTKMDLLKLD